MQNQATNMENRTMITTNSSLCKNANRINLKLYNFGYADVDTQWQGYVQNPTFSRLYYIASGNACIAFEGETLELIPGNWYLLPAGFSFHFSCSQEMGHLFFHITLSGADEIDILGNLGTPVSILDRSNPYDHFLEFLHDDTLITALTVKEKIYNTVLTLIANKPILPETTSYSPCVKKALEFINNNLSAKITLSDVAESAFVSNCTLTTKFKKELNLTVQEYIQTQRLFKAVQLLKNTKMSVAQISEKLGFSDQFYFSKCFKTKFGLSPREYRKSKID